MPLPTPPHPHRPSFYLSFSQINPFGDGLSSQCYCAVNNHKEEPTTNIQLVLIGGPQAHHLNLLITLLQGLLLESVTGRSAGELSQLQQPSTNHSQRLVYKTPQLLHLWVRGHPDARGSIISQGSPMALSCGHPLCKLFWFHSSSQTHSYGPTALSRTTSKLNFTSHLRVCF